MRQARWPQPDFMPAPPRTGLLVWLCLLVLGVVLGLQAQQALEQRAAHVDLDEQAVLLERLAAQARPRQSVAEAPANAEVQRKARAVAQQLDIDWRERWLSLEQALPAGLQLQALEIDGGQGLRIEGLAGEMAPVTQLVDRLALQAREDPGAQVELTRLQKAEGGEELLRFEIVRRRAGDVRGGS